MQRSFLVTVASLAALGAAGCGGSTQVEQGHYATVRCDICFWVSQAWRSPGGTTYVRTVRTFDSGAHTQPQVLRSPQPSAIVIQGRRVLDVPWGQKRVYRTPNTALFALYRAGRIPDPTLLLPALHRGELREAPWWVREVRKLIPHR
jgi:hypothetical protein